MGNLARFILWDFKRASWQYDVIVALILAFIFLTPNTVFRDQPKAANVVMLPAEQGTGLFWIAPQLLTGVPAADRLSKAATLVKAQYKRRATVTRVEPLKDSEDDITGYMAYTQP
ncbi:MAG TPA: hypothetical protein VGG72_09245 [Bryobacteraceae bacterium]|jgi:hypothetical protein